MGSLNHTNNLKASKKSLNLKQTNSGYVIDKLPDDFYNPVHFSSKKNQQAFHYPNPVEMITQNIKKKTKESSISTTTNIISKNDVTTTLGNIIIKKRNFK